MNNRGTVALIVVFFAGLLGLWWAEYAGVPDRAERLKAEPRVLPEIVSTRPENLRRIEIAGGPDRLVFERRDGNRWQMTSPVDVAADPSLVETLALNLKVLEKSRDAGTLPEDPKAFGLAPPVRTIRLFGDDPSRPIASLDVGNRLRDVRFVRTGGSSGAEVVDAKALAAIELPAVRWRDRALVRLPSFQVAEIEAVGPGRILKLRREGELWRIESPFRAPADDGRVEGLLGEVVSLRVADGEAGFVADNPSDLAPYGLDKPSLSITVVPRPGQQAPTQTIHLGKPAPSSEKGPRQYARRDDQHNVVMVDASLLQGLGANPTDLHGKKVADLNPARVDKIRLTSGDSSVTVARDEKGWSRLAPLLDKADVGAIGELLKKLNDLEAGTLFGPNSAPEPEVDKPWAVLEVWQRSPADDQSASTERAARLKLALGRRDAINKVVYARLVGDPVVMALPLSFLEGLSPGPLAFRDRQVASIPAHEVETVAITQGEKSFRLAAPPRGAEPTAWRLDRPVSAPADPESVGRLFTLLTNLRADALVTDRADADAKYGLDKPTLTASWTSRTVAQPPPLRPSGGESTTLTLGSTVPSKPGARYARVSTSPIVFTLPPETVAAFEVEWRDRQVMAFDVKRVELLTVLWPNLTINARPVPDANKESPDWSLVDPPAGLKLDPGKIKPLMASLAKLVTFRFTQYDGLIAPETGLVPPKVTIQVQAGGRPREIRLGNVTKDGYLYATTEYGPTGLVFLLPLRGWESWLNPPSVEKKPVPATPEAKPDAAKPEPKGAGAKPN